MPQILSSPDPTAYRSPSQTGIEATTSGTIVDALARQERMLAPQKTERFTLDSDPPATPHAAHALALLSVLPLTTPTATVPFTDMSFAHVRDLALIALQPLVTPTAAATHLPVAHIPHAPIVAPAPALQSRAYGAFTELAGWLGMTQEQTAALLGIGRTTPLAWRRGHEPQPARARRLFQTHALVKTLVRRLGIDATRRWLERGTPSPLELIRAGDVAAADDRADEIIFGPAVSSRLDGWRDEDDATPSLTSDPPSAALRRVQRRAPQRR